MKTKSSGSGVKAANKFEIVSKIEGQKFWNTYEIEGMKSKEMLTFWNYKAEGLNLENAKKELLACIEVRKERAKQKPKRATTKKTGYYLSLLEAKNERIKWFLKSTEEMEPVQHAYRYSYGNYKHKVRTFLLPGVAKPWPVKVTITWVEDHDWDYYAKSYGRPKSTYTDRAVEFKTIGKLGNQETIYRHELKTFAGNFVEKAIVAFLKVKKVRVANDLKPVQLDNYYKVVESKAINGYRLFERYIGQVKWDFAILDTKTKTTYHAWKYEDLIPGLRRKLQAKFDHENETITKETGFKLGFCETGMRSFAEDNGIDYEGSYTRQQLRNIVIEKRELNNRKYRRELAKVGIHLGR